MKETGLQFYRHAQVSEHIIGIEDVIGVKVFLITGNRHAALIDTATGFGNLKEYTDKLTTLPYTVICTHGHIDHAGGASWFDKVYLNPLDYELEKHHCSLEMKKAHNNSSAPVPRNYISPARTKPFTPLNAEMRFDLGSVTVRACPMPGYTAGMTCILIEEERSMILGDGCNPNTWLFLPESSTVEQYKKSLLAFKNKYSDLFDTVYLSHGPTAKYPPGLIDDCIDICDDILNHRDDAVHFEFMGNQGALAKSVNTDGRRPDGKLGNIVYNPKRICE
jgi:glyoxylase-like metal-dependent hydrolase (beta-lactamase superfamily II)